jgi:hypothetical protein
MMIGCTNKMDRRGMWEKGGKEIKLQKTGKDEGGEG